MMIGERIREARLAQHRSLSDVATKAKISTATLSRIENSKQGLDLGLFVTLAQVLKVSARELLAEGDEVDETSNPLVRRISALEGRERAQLWRDLAQSVRSRRGRRSEMQNLSQQVEELMAQTDFLREELEAVQNRLRRRR